jgi:hypothetical protein
MTLFEGLSTEPTGLGGPELALSSQPFFGSPCKFQAYPTQRVGRAGLAPILFPIYLMVGICV